MALPAKKIQPGETPEIPTPRLTESGKVLKFPGGKGSRPPVDGVTSSNPGSSGGSGATQPNNVLNLDDYRNQNNEGVNPDAQQDGPNLHSAPDEENDQPYDWNDEGDFDDDSDSLDDYNEQYGDEGDGSEEGAESPDADGEADSPETGDSESEASEDEQSPDKPYDREAEGDFDEAGRAGAEGAEAAEAAEVAEASAAAAEGAAVATATAGEGVAAGATVGVPVIVAVVVVIILIFLLLLAAVVFKGGGGGVNTSGGSPVTAREKGYSWEEVVRIFGDPGGKPVTCDCGTPPSTQWEKDNIIKTTFSGKTIYMHKKVVPYLKSAENEIKNNPDSAVRNYVVKMIGGYCFRRIRQGSCLSSPSNHAWGAAIDINWDTNPQCNGGCPFDLPMGFVNIMKKYGFAWGGDWGYADYMHFQWQGE